MAESMTPSEKRRREREREREAERAARNEEAAPPLTLVQVENSIKHYYLVLKGAADPHNGVSSDGIVAASSALSALVRMRTSMIDQSFDEEKD